MRPKDIELPKKTIIAGWKVVKRLGAGGQGVVWEVRRARGKAPPAALKACFHVDEKARARFLREIKLLNECKSNHVLPLREQNLTWTAHVKGKPEFAYYVSELCSNGDLKKERARSSTHIARLLHLFREACDAIAFLHSRKDAVIHRDLKPSNFLCANEPERIVIGDFGIAKELGDEANLTSTNEVVGSQFFRAPEILNGYGGSERSDIYSMGRILEWLFTGELPKSMAPQLVPRGRTVADDACDALDRVIARAADMEAANRYSSVADLRDDLPNLWLSVRPAPDRPRQTSPGLSLENVYDQARDAVRSDDWTAWRELENGVRASYRERALAWGFQANETRQGTPEEWRVAGNSLVEIAMPRMVLALVGAMSGKRVADQRRAVGDLARIQEWGYSLVRVADAPRSLAYLFHYLYGAACVHVDEHEAAIRVAQTMTSRTISAETPLWLAPEVGLWGGIRAFWTYLCDLCNAFPVLRNFFADDQDYFNDLAVYGMVLSLFELASDARELVKRGRVDALDLELAVRPMFATMDSGVVSAAARRVFGDRRVVRHVSELQVLKLRTCTGFGRRGTAPLRNLQTGTPTSASTRTFSTWVISPSWRAFAARNWGLGAGFQATVLQNSPTILNSSRSWKR